MDIVDKYNAVKGRMAAQYVAGIMANCDFHIETAHGPSSLTLRELVSNMLHGRQAITNQIDSGEAVPLEWQIEMSRFRRILRAFVNLERPRRGY